MVKQDLIGFLRCNRSGETMLVTTILHQLLDSRIHKTRIKLLIPVIQAIHVCKQLRLTQ